MTPNEHDLLMAYLNRELPADAVAALEVRLKTEPALADALVLLAREESILTEWAHSSAGAAVETSRRAAGISLAEMNPAARRLRFGVIARWAAAAAVVLVVWGAYRMSGERPSFPPAAVVVETVQGDVTLETIDGDVAIADGQQVLPGQIVRTGGDDSSVVLRYPDNTRIILGDHTTVSNLRPDGAVKGGPGNRVFVDEGQLTAVVARPMSLGTPHAEVRSDAGRFICSSAAAATRVEPEEGRVRFTRNSDGSSIEVRTGFYAVATDLPEGAVDPFTPRSRTTPLTEPRTTLPDATVLVLAMAFSPDGHTLVTGGADGTLKFWEMPAGTLSRTFKAHAGAIRHVEFSRDGRLLLTNSNDRRPKVFDAATGQEKLALRKHRSDVDGAAFSPDGRVFATVFSNAKDGSEVRFWQTASGQEIGAIRVANTQVLSLDWSADGGTLVLGCRDGSVRLWGVTAQAAADRVTVQERQTLIGHGGEVRCVVLSARGGRVASAGVDGTARLWDAADGRELRVLTAHAREVRSVAFSEDGRFLVTSGNDATARLWQVENGREILTVKVRRGAVVRALLSPDGKTLVTAGADRTIRLWDLEPERHAADGRRAFLDLAVAFR